MFGQLVTSCFLREWLPPETRIFLSVVPFTLEGFAMTPFTSSNGRTRGEVSGIVVTVLLDDAEEE